MRKRTRQPKLPEPVRTARPVPALPARPRPTIALRPILQLQRSIGNRATGLRLMAHAMPGGPRQPAAALQRRPGHGPVSERPTATSIQRAPARPDKPAKPAEPVGQPLSAVENGAYKHIVAAQNELEALLADFKHRALKFDDPGISFKLQRAFIELREAWRAVPVADHASLRTALAAYSRASEEVGVYVYLLPLSPAIEDARFWLEQLRWLETRMTPVTQGPPPPAQAVTDLRQDMERQIDNWKEACRAGIGEFVHAELASLIDALSEGNWNSFFMALVGNTVWAAAAFVPAGAPAFALSMAGIAIASAPTVPQKGAGKGELARIEDQLHAYIEKIHEKLNAQLASRAVSLLREHPGATAEEGLGLFLEASFRPDMIRHGPSSIDETRVRRTMRESAAYTLALLREVSKVEGVVGDIRTAVAWLSPPDYGPKRLAVVVSSNAGTRFLRWVPEENEALALMTQRSQPIGVHWYLFEQQAEAHDPLYLAWLVQHGWKQGDGFGLEWFQQKYARDKAPAP